MATCDIPAKCLGETGALSLKKPTDQDLKHTEELESALSQLNIFETPEEAAQRREALMRLQEICNTWIQQKAVEQNLPSHVVNTTSGKIFTFGSYRLGVNFIGADVDSLLVVPRFISRDEFFGEFQELLTNDPNVDEIHAVVHAYVPVLKLKFMGVDIDLLFAQADIMTVPSNFNLCENTEVLMRNMDERDVRSINGVRVNEDILGLVYNTDSFKVALKAIRFWAKRRNIYSNTLGFLGGVSWAILVARICQLYPYATPSMIICLFFNIFSQWPWPKPVRLREPEYIPSLGLPIWDPRLNPPDQYHLLPILTPSYPSQNSTYNVQRSNRIILEGELKRGLSIVQNVLLRKQPWSALFEPSFFFNYRHYVVVTVTGSVKRPFVELCGLVESRLRVLIGNFEQNRHVKIAHVNCASYGKGPSDDDSLFVRKWLIGMEFDRNPGGTNSYSVNHTTNVAADKPTLNVDLSEHIASFEKSIERGFSPDDSSAAVSVNYVKKSNLGQFISHEDMVEIKRMATSEAVRNSNVVAKKNKPMNASATSTDTVATTNGSPNHSDSSSLLRSSSSASCSSIVDLKLASSPSVASPERADSMKDASSGYPVKVSADVSEYNSLSPENSRTSVLSKRDSTSLAGPISAMAKTNSDSVVKRSRLSEASAS